MAVVFQQRQNKTADFTREKGMAVGKRAYSYARDNIGQPESTAIYFGVDFDAGSSEVDSNIIPFFEGIKGSFHGESNGNPIYRVGAYGSGFVCTILEEKNLIALTWLSMSRGFRGTREAYDEGRYHLCQKAPATRLCGLGVDYNEVNPQINDFGEFIVEDDVVSEDVVDVVRGERYRVVARRGLRLREGPGTQFDIVDGLRSGQVVYVTSINEGWARVDVEGDGQIDGFASAAFLEHT